MTMDVRIDGVGRLAAGEYGRVDIDGVGRTNGDIKFDKMDIDGTCTCHGKLEGNILDVDGMAKVNGDIRVSKLNINGLLKSNSNKIYADEIRVDGMLKIGGEVNADRIKIDGCANVDDLFGDEITINFSKRVFSVFTFKQFNWIKMNHANNIECSTLRASFIKCHTISANDIILSDHCEVDVIQCDGKLKFDSTCKIGRIEGDCTQNRG